MQIKNNQAFFGGMPMTAEITKFTNIIHELPKIKKFNTTEFLDNFFKQSAIQQQHTTI